MADIFERQSFLPPLSTQTKPNQTEAFAGRLPFIIYVCLCFVLAFRLSPFGGGAVRKGKIRAQDACGVFLIQQFTPPGCSCRWISGWRGAQPKNHREVVAFARLGRGVELPLGSSR